jgi:predicted nuclease of restriction endonuclease-like (RecB) superfamily
LINLYWNVDAYISKQISNAGWGEKTVDELAAFIQKNYPELKGFYRRGLYRMNQFYETYASMTFVSPVMTQMQISDIQNSKIVPAMRTQMEISDIRNSIIAKLSWTHHRTIFSRCKLPEEMEFYIKLSVKENYSSRELDRQITAGLFERVMIGKSKLPSSIKEIQPDINSGFKDSYIFEFLNLPDSYSESDLQKGLIKQMKKFILELGKDFLFIDEEYKIQVGNSDFYIDLLFYHRGLQCLVAFELKADKFNPSHLGQINFYLEALDRDVKKPNENPSIGILLCKDKDNEVVEYALSRSLSSTMISEYKTQLPDKKLLQEKLHELFENYGGED